MKYTILVFAAVIISLASCGKKDAVTTAVTDPSFTEDFDTLSNAIKKGWVISNNTKPIGTIGWVQGFYFLSLHHSYDSKLGSSNNPYIGGFGGISPGFSGADFVMTTSDCGNGVATCSNWLISPAVQLKNGDEISFYTRTYANPAAGADRLQVRINTVNSSADVGREATSVGNFSEVILDINPDYLLEDEGSYPEEWTKYTATVSGLSTARKSRIALRYFVEQGGPLGDNSVGIGIDRFQFISK